MKMLLIMKERNLKTHLFRSARQSESELINKAAVNEPQKQKSNRCKAVQSMKDTEETRRKKT